MNGYSAGKRTVTPMDTELMAVAADAAADNSSENLGSTYFCSLKKTIEKFIDRAQELENRIHELEIPEESVAKKQKCLPNSL